MTATSFYLAASPHAEGMCRASAQPRLSAHEPNACGIPPTGRKSSVARSRPRSCAGVARGGNATPIPGRVKTGWLGALGAALDFHVPATSRQRGHAVVPGLLDEGVARREDPPRRAPLTRARNGDSGAVLARAINNTRTRAAASAAIPATSLDARRPPAGRCGAGIDDCPAVGAFRYHGGVLSRRGVLSRQIDWRYVGADRHAAN